MRCAKTTKKSFDTSLFYCTFFSVCVLLLIADECIEEIMNMFHKVMDLITFLLTE